MLYELGDDFQGFSAEAVWDDAKLGLSHLTAFEAVAVVTDVHWITTNVKLFGLLLRCPVKVFRTRNSTMPKSGSQTPPRGARSRR